MSVFKYAVTDNTNDALPDNSEYDKFTNVGKRFTFKNCRLLSKSCDVDEVEEADDNNLFGTPPTEHAIGDCFDEETVFLFLIGVVIGGVAGLCRNLQGDVDTNRRGCWWSFCDEET